MKNKEKVIVLIDGSNFYYKLKSLNIKNTTKYNYKGLARYLAEKRKIIDITYYVGAVRAKRYDKRSQQLRRGQQRLFNHLLSPSQKIKIVKDFLMNNKNKYHEKGVDVKIAVDLLIGAYENKYDIAILISSDTDLIPAIKKIKQLKKRLEYIGFSHNPSLGLQKYATVSRLLMEKEVKKFEIPSLL